VLCSPRYSYARCSHLGVGRAVEAGRGTARGPPSSASQRSHSGGTVTVTGSDNGRNAWASPDPDGGDAQSEAGSVAAASSWGSVSTGIWGPKSPSASAKSSGSASRSSAGSVVGNRDVGRGRSGPGSAWGGSNTSRDHVRCPSVAETDSSAWGTYSNGPWGK
jgi:hypothetical protein